MSIPIDPKTGKLGKAIDVPDSYNLYFTPDGKSAIMVAEAMRRLEFRDPHTMALQGYIATPAVRRASTTPTSPPTAPTRSSPANSATRSPRSTSSTTRSPACCR